MLVDMIEEYSKEKKEFLVDLWQKTLQHLTIDNDPKKIISFLSKCWIISIDEKEKVVYFGVPNEFVLSQVQKFFKKPLATCIQQVYNENFKVKFEVYEKFQTGKHALQINVKTILGVIEKKQQELDPVTKEKLSDFFWNLFDPKFRFDNFVVWSNSQLAYSACQQVSENPGIVYNPLFVYWDVGLWKTHVLQAVWNYIMDHHKEKVIVYLPTTKLIDEIIEAIRKNKLSSIYKKFEEVDVLILDDIQFLADKDKTQEIFHNIFNDFHSKKKQIILSSDRPPKDLNWLEARLRSRFAIWLVCDIKKPDFETRFAILKAKLREKGEELDRDFLEIIAKHLKDTVREIEGIVNLLITKKKLLGRDIQLEDVYDSLETTGYNVQKDNAKVDSSAIDIANQKNVRSKDNFGKIVDYISNYYNVSVYDLKWDSRKKEVSLWRQMLMYIAKKQFDWTLEKIWDYFWGKNHATVIYAINNFEKLMKHNKKLWQDLQIILNEVM